MSNRHRKVLFVTPSLRRAGAEKMLISLAIKLKSAGYEIYVFSFERGPYEAELRAFGIETMIVEVKKWRDYFHVIKEIQQYIRKVRPDILQTWMYKADFIGGIAGHFEGHKRIFWNIRHGEPSLLRDKLSTKCLIFLCGLLSWIIPFKIVSCCKNSKKHHAKFGYKLSKFVYAPNHISSLQFYPEPKSGNNFRKEMGLSKNDFLIGVLGREHPQKAHERIAKIFQQKLYRYENIWLVIAGEGVEKSKKLLGLKNKHKDQRLILLPHQEDTRKFYNSLDLFLVPSRFGEGFPNVLLEAIQCEIPVLTTDVGDSAEIVAEKDSIADKRYDRSIFDKVLKSYNTSPQSKRVRSKRLKKSIMERFSEDLFLDRYIEIYNVGAQCNGK